MIWEAFPLVLFSRRVFVRLVISYMFARIQWGSIWVWSFSCGRAFNYRFNFFSRYRVIQIFLFVIFVSLKNLFIMYKFAKYWLCHIFGGWAYCFFNLCRRIHFILIISFIILLTPSLFFLFYCARLFLFQETQIHSSFFK